VRLPLVTSASSDSPASAVAPALAETQGKTPRRILVVDDNRDAAKTLSLLLEHSGHIVRSAFAGGAALDIAREFEPDIVLLDIGLPDMDGWQLARTLRREGRGAGLKVIAISGYGQKEDRRRSEDAGIDHHLTKPVDYAEIRKCL
jgi:CheY-like chemotaxis protein